MIPDQSLSISQGAIVVMGWHSCTEKGSFTRAILDALAKEYDFDLDTPFEDYPPDIRDVIIASVVPDVMHSLTNAILKYFEITPVIVGPGIKTGIRVVTENPKQIGADRIVDAAAAYALYGGPVLVLDFGTATTYDLVDGKGSFVAGVTAPGIRISAKALWEDAAKLPKIEICKPASILAQETISSMQAGLVYGQIGQTEYIVRNMAKESGYSDLKVVATGGLGRIIANETDCIDIYDPNLTLSGLRLIFEKQKQ